jgi:histidinol dehydrogenase
MKTIINPHRNNWGQIIARPLFDRTALFDRVRTILDEVKNSGDEAIRRFTLQFDGVKLDQFAVSSIEIDEAVQSVLPSLKKAIEMAAGNIERFHKAQLQKPEIIETMPGIKCWRKSVAIDKVGFYIPGGTAPLFSTVLMLGIPARLAGCNEIILCTPPAIGGAIPPAILFAAQLVGVTKIFKIGGVQAIGAMAYGTETIPSVYKIFGPGNQYVNGAKQLIQLDGIAIDMPAGPSEVCVMADESCDPSFVAADLLSQAEHGTDSQVLLVCNNNKTVGEILIELEMQNKTLSRIDVIEKVLKNSHAIVVENPDDAIELVNEYAPEHLIIACKDAALIADKIVNAGSVFLGNYSPESAGDYASGTNHVLPTNGYAKSYSGVSVDSFVKKISYQQITKKGLEQIGNAIQQMATAEGLDAHKSAISMRMSGND